MMDKGEVGHYDVEMKGWMENDGIMMCKCGNEKGWMDKGGGIMMEMKGWMQKGQS